jgi:hypothetical protein
VLEYAITGRIGQVVGICIGLVMTTLAYVADSGKNHIGK